LVAIKFPETYQTKYKIIETISCAISFCFHCTQMSFTSRQAWPDRVRLRGVVGPRRVKPAVGRVMHTIKDAVQQLQKDSDEHFFLEQESADSFKYVCSQVKALQKGFTTLADAVLEDLDSVREESQKHLEERDNWQRSFNQLAAEVRGRCADLESQQGQLRAALSHADVAALRHDGEQMKKLAGETETRLCELKANIRDLHLGLSHCTNTCTDLRAAASDSQRRTASASKSTSHLKEELEKIRQENSTASASLARDAAMLAEEAQSVRGWCEKSFTMLESRMRKAEESASGGSSRKLQAVMAQQARGAKSVEEMVKTLTEDNVKVAKAARELDSSVGLLRRCTEEHHDALMRSCQVFATALKIPSPMVSMPSLTTSVTMLKSPDPALESVRVQ